MTSPLLTIAIPTYNRSDCLDLLLRSVLAQCAGLAAVEVLVLNNASTDATSEVLQRHAINTHRTALRIINNTENLGLDGNVSACFANARGAHVWIIGDDDLPTANSVAQLLAILEEKAPDILFMSATSHKGALDGFLDNKSNQPVPVRLSAKDFAYTVSSMLTFLSSIVVSKSRFLVINQSDRIGKYAGTSLGHMEWIFALLSKGERFFYIAEEMVHARSANTGGYKLFQVFATNYSKIVMESLNEDLAMILLKRHTYLFLPHFVWTSRFDYLGNFESEKITEQINYPFRRFIAFWILLMPMARFPKIVAKPFHILAKITWHVSAVCDRYRLHKAT